MAREYKGSGIEWIGEIPSHWKIDKVTRLFEKIGSGTTPKTIDDNNFSGSINWIQSGDINDSLLIQCKNRISDRVLDEYSALKIYHSPFIIVAMYGASVGNTSLCLINGCVNQACCVLSQSKMNLNYAFAVVKSCKDYWLRKAVGGGQPNISQDTIKSTWLPFPPLPEQRAIADYLDRKCGEIDELISLQEKIIEELKAYKQSVITETVTKGLNPDVPMKDSGIEWIGEIPSHWRTIRLRNLCEIATGDKDTIMKNEDGLYPFFVRSPKVERINEYSFDMEAILMAGDGVGAGKVFHYYKGKFGCHQRVYCLFNFSKFIKPHFLLYFMSYKFKELFIGLSAKSTVDSVRLPMLKDFIIMLPSIGEQQEIIQMLDNKCSEIDCLIALKQKKIEELKDYKKSIIYECVTGKKEV